MERNEDFAFDAAALLKLAREALSRAYAPYSSFPVGAAILFDNGEVVKGCNVENGSYGLSICAERNAMASAVGSGHLKPVAIAVVNQSGELCPPCGACRQFLSEFNGDMHVVMEDKGDPVVYRLSELLPMQFTLSGKEDAGDEQ